MLEKEFIENVNTEEQGFIVVVLLACFLQGVVGKESVCNSGDSGSIPGLGRSAGEGSGYPLQRSYLENPMDRGAWQVTVHGFAKSWTKLSDFTFFSFLQQRSGGQNIKRLLLIKENQMSQVNEFSVFLCMGRGKRLGSLKLFL